MATAPVKSQPLHNFSLSLLKWGNSNQVNNHRARKRDSPPESSRRSPPSETESESDHDVSTAKGSPNGGSRSGKNRSASAAAASSSPADKLRKNGDGGDEEKEKRGGGGDEKPWNLRPRRAVAKGGSDFGGGSGCVKNGGGESQSGRAVHAVSPVAAAVQGENLPKSMRLRGLSDAQGTEKKEKTKVWISLSRDEIEEDIFIMTGTRPARRPRKRPKNVQKNIENVLPGLWLAGVTVDAYRVPDAPAKR